ncbi:protein-disulfide reductase DsbD family protein [Tunturiibacter gelidoferens]|uniref:Thiol:disulfide interchange protein DsbD n=1 Tax=Tunturiibacter gelidiferens TaxID=3069689 RepID=A0A9X0U4W1_9BACT|nr:thioredoxin family protein [Edaphobacter lichenicola]MBB5328207.1 thiol:disulfide interchange protein DsbD [Edaphobacter lichenicola]
MNNVSKFSAFLLLACASLFLAPARAQLQVVGDGGPGPIKAQHLTAELVSLSPDIAPGGTLQVGLVLTLEEHWHVYWINAGDSGEPPKITWTLPEGITAGPMLFPIPSRLPLGPLMDFGYEDEVAFPVQLTAASSLKPGPTHIDAKVTYLVCREVCIPGKAHLGLNLNVVPEAAAAQPVGALGEALGLIPKPLPPDAKLTVTGGKTDFVLNFTTGGRETNAEFYPADQDQIANAAPQQIEPTSDGVRLRVRRSEDLKTLPAQLHGVLKLSDNEAYDVTAPVTPGEVAPSPGSKVAGSPATSSVTTISAIGLAFVGGIILNLMPCVFPVLFLKGLALVQSSGQERKHLRSHGLVYTLGILVSFWIIVAALLILRATGSQAGWGFQLQSPTFIAVLAAGLFFFALSLAGQFDLGLSLTSVGGGLAQKQGYAGSFFTGVLATIVATPCTAPLMGAAIGFALAQPAGITFAVFTALALGLATPYLLLSFQPAWTRILPRPGAWMEILKQLTAVPLFGTAIWLAWVYGNLHGGNSQGVDHLTRLLWCFLALAIAGWALGKWPANWKSAIAALLIAAVGLAIPLYQPKDTSLVWAPYSQQSLDQARAAGHPVFIDFTAAWCLSCQVNERAVLKSADVQHQFSKNNVTLLKADWTQYDPEITKQLASVNRSGVPTYVIYPAIKNSSADVLPELLTKDIVLTALEKDVKQ